MIPKPRKVLTKGSKRTVGRLAFGESLNTRVFKVEVGAFLRLCEGVNTPRSLACWLMAKHGEWNAYLQLSPPDPLSKDFRVDYLVTECMRKNPRIQTGINTREVAWNLFQEHEVKCRETNERLSNFKKNAITAPPLVAEVIFYTQSIIAGILGPLDSSKLAFAEKHFRFGPGSTSSVSGKDVLLSKKMVSKSFDTTPRLATFWSSILSGWIPPSQRKLRGYSKVVFVPKDATKDRTIAIEPHLNIYVQLGLGALIRRQLERSGLVTNDQNHNRRLAKLAILKGWATVDLTGASDCVSSELVSLLLPSDWVDLLACARTDFSEDPYTKAIFPLEKFSSMGNGFTWELETLIFYAMARATNRVLGVSDPVASAYGDDIIINAESVALLSSVLTFTGFALNRKKTFWRGVFYESCGADFHCGMDVRPFFFKGDYHDFHSAIVRMANAVRRHAHRLGNRTFCDNRLLPAWLYLTRQSRVASLTGISEGYGDDGLIRNWDEATPRRARDQWDGWRGLTLSTRPKDSRRTDPAGALLGALAWGARDRPRSVEFERGSVRRTQLSYQVFCTWYNLGPWA